MMPVVSSYCFRRVQVSIGSSQVAETNFPLDEQADVDSKMQPRGRGSGSRRATFVFAQEFSPEKKVNPPIAWNGNERRSANQADPEIGNSIRKVVPAPFSLSTSIVPPCRSTIWRTMESPRPVPRFLVVKNGSNRWFFAF